MSGSSFYVIERHVYSVLHFWDGRKMPFPWTKDINSACRLADHQSAEVLLAYYLDGVGNVVEHAWIGAAP